MAIILQSSVGGFSAEFMREVADARKGDDRARAGALAIRDLEGLRLAGRRVHVLRPFFYDYTVFIGGEHFTLTEPNDIRFLDYFYQRCIADGRDARPNRIASARAGLISRIFRWMAQPI